MLNGSDIMGLMAMISPSFSASLGMSISLMKATLSAVMPPALVPATNTLSGSI